MEVSVFLLKFCLILIFAKALGEAFARMGLPAVIGEVVAGIVIGPGVLGLVGREDVFMLLADIGVLFLLFKVGVETDVGKLAKVGGQSLMVAVTGVALPFVSAYFISRWMGISPPAAMFMGGALVATSIGITVRVLRDLGLGGSHVARVVLGAAVIDDVIGVIVLAVLVGYVKAGAFSIGSGFAAFAYMAGMLILAPTTGPVIRRALKKASALARTPGLFTAMVVALVLAFSGIAGALGVPEIIGALAAGFALTGTPPVLLWKAGPDEHKLIAKTVEGIEKGVTPLAELFIPVFFVMVGVSMDVSKVNFASGSFWGLSAALFAAAFVTKVIAGAWTKGTARDKVLSGIAMVPRGEVGLVFAQAGLASYAFDAGLYASAVFIVALTTLSAPVALKFAARR